MRRPWPALDRSPTGGGEGKKKAVLWLRPLFGLSSRRPLFNLRPVHVTFVLKTVSLRQVFLPVLQFSPVGPYVGRERSVQGAGGETRG